MRRREFLCSLTAASLLGRWAAGAVRKQWANRSPATRENKYLLLDSRLVDRIENARLVPGRVEKDARNPLFGEDKPWEVRFDNLYPNVQYVAEEKIYKLWYNTFIIDETTSSTPLSDRAKIPYRPSKNREMGLCYAFSRDGIVWEKPDLGVVEFNGSKRNNLVMRHIHGVGVQRDLHDQDSSRRYKAFMKEGVATSPDGIHWSKVLPCSEIQAVADTHNNSFWDARSNRYVGITRLWDHAERLVGRTESFDFRRWTKALEVLRGEPDKQTYAMLVFPCANVYLGLLMIMDTSQNPLGLVDCELAWSPDTKRWERVAPGVPLIPRGPKGSYDWGCIYAAAYPVAGKDGLRLYYGGSDGPHTAWRKGSFNLAHLRPDGFAGMKPVNPAHPGMIITTPVGCVGEKLVVSADAAAGALRVAVLDAEGMTLDRCVPIVTNVTGGVVNWRGGSSLAAIKGKRVRLLFELHSARLYAFSFTS